MAQSKNSNIKDLLQVAELLAKKKSLLTDFEAEIAKSIEKFIIDHQLIDEIKSISVDAEKKKIDLSVEINRHIASIKSIFHVQYLNTLAAEVLNNKFCNLVSQTIGNSDSDNDKIASFTSDITDIKSKLQDNTNNYGIYDKYRNKTVVFAERDNKIYLVIILSIDASKNAEELNIENVIIVDQSLMIPIL